MVRRVVLLWVLVVCVTAMNLRIGRHSWASTDDTLDAYATHAGFTAQQIVNMKENGESLFLAAAAAISQNQPTRKGTNDAVTVGAQPNMFFIELVIGSSNQTFRVNLDTGSSTLAIPHVACSNCGSHCHNPYKYENSTTPVACSSRFCCDSSRMTCRDVCAPSPQSSYCGFSVQYGDNSQISGSWVCDLVSVANFSNVPLCFGSILSSTDSFEPFQVDGIVGVALNSLNQNLAGTTYSTLIDALKSNKGIPKIFSICFGLDGGNMLFGGVDSEHMAQKPQYTPFDRSTGFYEVSVTRMSMGGNTVGPSHAAIIDTGTTLWYVPQATYNAITSQLRSSCGSICSQVSSLLSGKCVIVSDQSLNALPSIVIEFAGGGNITVSPLDYMRKGLCTGSSKYRAFGITQATNDCKDTHCIYGDVLMLSSTWVFDQEQSRVGFAPRVGCNSVNATELSTCPNKESTTSRWLIILLAVLVPLLGLLICCGAIYAIVRCCCPSRNRARPNMSRETTLVLSNPLLPQAVAVPLQPGREGPTNTRDV